MAGTYCTLNDVKGDQVTPGGAADAYVRLQTQYPGQDYLVLTAGDIANLQNMAALAVDASIFNNLVTLINQNGSVGLSLIYSSIDTI